VFTIKIGPTTTEIESVLVERLAREVTTTGEEIAVIHRKVERLLAGVEGAPRIQFRIGPITVQE
jgi:hypothetical protein